MAAGIASLRPFRSVFAMRFMLMLQYRTAALAGFVTQCWWGVIKLMVFAAFFHSGKGPQTLSLTQVISYIWLGQAFLVLLPWWGDPEVIEMVRNGNVSYERLRPLDTYFFWYARAMGWMLARVVPRALMMFTLAGIVVPALGLGAWRLRLPASLEAAVLFVVAMFFTVLLSSAILMLINIVVVVTIAARGPTGLATQIGTIFSGLLIPLPFFPSWMQRFLFLQPFAGLMDIPFRIYMGNLSGSIAIVGISLMVMWVIVLVATGHRMMGRVMSRLQIQGG